MKGLKVQKPQENSHVDSEQAKDMQVIMKRNKHSNIFHKSLGNITGTCDCYNNSGTEKHCTSEPNQELFRATV